MPRYGVELVPGSMVRVLNGRNGSKRDGHYYNVVDSEANPNDDIVAECPSFSKAKAVADSMNRGPSPTEELS